MITEPEMKDSIETDCEHCENCEMVMGDAKIVVVGIHKNGYNRCESEVENDEWNYA